MISQPFIPRIKAADITIRHGRPISRSQLVSVMHTIMLSAHVGKATVARLPVLRLPVLRDHVGALAWRSREQAFGVECVYGLAHGDLGDAELFG